MKKQDILLQIINEELLRENLLDDVASGATNGWNKVKGAYNRHVAPHVNNAIRQSKNFINNTVVPAANNVGNLGRQVIGDPVSSFGKYNNIEIPDIKSIRDLVKLETCKNSNGRTWIRNNFQKRFKNDPKDGENFFKRFKVDPYIELTTYEIFSKEYPTSHSQLKIGLQSGNLCGYLDTFIDDADYSMISNNCANATFSCICKALGYSVKEGLSAPQQVMKWFAKQGAKNVGTNASGGIVQKLDVGILTALRGLFYIMEYIKLGL